MTRFLDWLLRRKSAIGRCPYCGMVIWAVDGITCVSDHCNECKMEHEC
jgi:hypothetical protein